ncbi:hypothetical protein Y032_0010g881 [Ancylostoma ceylanicum]|uniref:Uncharacterized protein n=1 Tax=Ancylostoma ceylanicum TaxID=53326 RepID=A0A016VH80_9BILA|nr:hypothetical protein Y032_0010g881 [Ancylostoma ceylanicum]
MDWIVQQEFQKKQEKWLKKCSSLVSLRNEALKPELELVVVSTLNRRKVFRTNLLMVLLKIIVLIVVINSEEGQDLLYKSITIYVCYTTLKKYKTFPPS